MPNGEAVLCDAGPLVAIYDPGDPAHGECHESLRSLRESLVTTWPVVTEAMYLLDRLERQDLLWDLILRGGLWLADLQPTELPRMRALIHKYSDLPMDLADASLVVVGERLKLRKVFTLDRRHFRLYRPRHVRSFEIFP